MDDTVEALMHNLQPPKIASGSKVTVVGVGQVGMACAYSILQQGIASEIALVDVVADKLEGEWRDLQHGLAFSRSYVLKAGTGMVFVFHSLKREYI